MWIMKDNVLCELLEFAACESSLEHKQEIAFIARENSG